MGGIWGDGYFYLAAAGFLISFVLFLFLLGQYRAAVEAGDDAPEPVPPVPAPSPVVPTVTRFGGADAPTIETAKPVEKPVEKTLILEKKPEAAPAPGPEVNTASYAGPERRKSDTTTGQLSPAVVYLQNMKTQLEKFDADIAALKASASQQSAQGEAIIQRLAALTDALNELRAAPAPRAESAPAAIEPPPGFTLPESPAPVQPLSIEPSSVPPPQPEPGSALPPGATSPMELKLDAPAAAPLPQAPAESEKPRKGPVWPV